MSYCRIGEQGSDVYMFSDGTQWFIDTLEEYHTLDTLEEARGTLLELQARGLHVPAPAMDRVKRELEDPQGAREEYRQKFLGEIEAALAEETTGYPSRFQN